MICRVVGLRSGYGTNRTNRAGLAMSSVDGSRVARAKLTQWHWSGQSSVRPVDAVG